MTMNDFRVTVEARPPLTVISVSGEVDIITEPKFRSEVEKALDQPEPHLLFDLTELRFIDSAGLRVILDAYTRLGRDRLTVCGPSAAIQRLFHLLGLTGRLRIYRTLEEAVGSGGD
jgi:anti-anti-sigma factor